MHARVSRFYERVGVQLETLKLKCALRVIHGCRTVLLLRSERVALLAFNSVPQGSYVRPRVVRGRKLNLANGGYGSLGGSHSPTNCTLTAYRPPYFISHTYRVVRQMLWIETWPWEFAFKAVHGTVGAC
jgi:hypothetical protein